MQQSKESATPVCHPYYKKFTKADHINSQAKQVILNVFFHLSSLNPQKAWTVVAKEASALTGVSAGTIFRLKNEKQTSVLQEKMNCDSLSQCDVNPENPDSQCLSQIPMSSGQSQKKKEKGSESPRSWKKRIKAKPKKRKERFDEATLSAIRYKVEDLAYKIKTLSGNKLLQEINADPNLPNFKKTTFYKVLKDMGYAQYLKKPNDKKTEPKSPKKNNICTGNPEPMMREPMPPVKDPTLCRPCPINVPYPWNG